MSEQNPPIKSLHVGEFLELQRRAHWEFVRRTNSSGGAAFLIALTDEKELVLVEQHRLPVGKQVIELPAGIIGDNDASESIETAALRELEEETGFQAQSAEIIFDAPTAAGLTSEWSYFLRMHQLERIHAGGGVEDENIITHVIPLSRLNTFLRQAREQGKAIDARIYTAVQLLSVE